MFAAVDICIIPNGAKKIHQEKLIGYLFVNENEEKKNKIKMVIIN